MFRRKGMQYERLAENWLENCGLHSLSRNFNCRVGELDLVMLDGPTLVFVEVRYRANTSFGTPEDTVTRAKQQRVVRAAQIFLQRYPGHAQRNCRFDVVAITGDAERPEVRWIKDAFSA
ncbi:MAG: hypothetical protein RL434_1277 [Pseudomonadota bacterium]|jgi:putative endonuclease